MADPLRNPGRGDVVELTDGSMRVVLRADEVAITFWDLPAQRVWTTSMKGWRQRAKGGRVILGAERDSYQHLLE